MCLPGSSTLGACRALRKECHVPILHCWLRTLPDTSCSSAYVAEQGEAPSLGRQGRQHALPVIRTGRLPEPMRQRCRHMRQALLDCLHAWRLSAALV